MTAPEVLEAGRSARVSASILHRLSGLLADRDSYRSDLDAIFTRIKDGKTVELHYPGREKIVVAALSAAPGEAGE